MYGRPDQTRYVPFHLVLFCSYTTPQIPIHISDICITISWPGPRYRKSASLRTSRNYNAKIALLSLLIYSSFFAKDSSEARNSRHGMYQYREDRGWPFTLDPLLVPIGNTMGLLNQVNGQWAIFRSFPRPASTPVFNLRAWLSTSTWASDVLMHHDRIRIPNSGLDENMPRCCRRIGFL
jgi:hypothetical protein